MKSELPTLTDTQKNIAVSKPKEYFLEEFEIGEVLGTGRIGIINTGSFAKVRLAKNIQKKTYHALKTMRKDELIRFQQVDHIMNEMKIQNYISHPFIVKLNGYIQDDKYLYIIQELINGGELFTVIRALGKLDLYSARFFSGHMVLIFEYLHSMNIIYRDLKPENVLIDKTGYLKLTDFGFAKYCEHRTYTLCGTPEYLAPEILLNKGHGKPVDWWTFGVFLFELIAGHDPFQDEEPMKVYNKILSGVVKFPKFFDKDAKSLVKKLLKIDLSKRYGNLNKGVGKIKSHRFYKDLCFEKLLNQELKPPYMPRVLSDYDISNFPVIQDKVQNATVPKDDPFMSWV